MDIILAGATNQSILFSLAQDGLTLTEFRLSYTRWSEGDGTSFTIATNAMTLLASITTAHTDNAGIYMSATATDGTKFLLRTDVPDAAFAAGKDFVIISVYDDLDEEVAQRTFRLSGNPINLQNVRDAMQLAATSGTGAVGSLDEVLIDPIAEATQGLPPILPTLLDTIKWRWSNWRNKSTETATIQKIENDAGTVLAKRPTQSDDGTTFTNSKWVSGP